VKLIQLLSLTESIPVNQLTEKQLRELQTALNLLGYPAGKADGLFGPKTRNAWAEFNGDIDDGNPTMIGPISVERLQEKLDHVALGKDYDLTTKQGTIDAIKLECRAQGIGLNTQIAYVLATVDWETNQTFKPVKEAYWLSEEWRRTHLRYYPYYGRGYVQLTWDYNYRTYSELLNVDMVSNPDLALQGEIALFVLVHGFKVGTFTGRKITDYINDNKTDFESARHCINGTDHHHDIALRAQRYLNNA